MAGPVILTLGSWAEQHLQEVLTAKSKSTFTEAFDAFVAPHAHITVNGKSMSRSAYMKMLWNDEANETSGSVSFKGTVAVPKDSKEIIQVRSLLVADGRTRANERQTGEVGVFFTATIHRSPLLFSNNITSSINLVYVRFGNLHTHLMNIC